MYYLGIDAGSSYIKFLLEDEDGATLLSKSVHHRGRPMNAALAEMGRIKVEPLVICASGTVSFDGMDMVLCDGLLAETAYIRETYPQRTLLALGAEKIELVRFNDSGGILEYRTNASCAAGTGSFLDEQMARLGLDASELDSIPIMDGAPMVATRCAVFAKTDLIHLQQEGHTARAMYNGLCRGLVISSLKSVFGGGIPDGEGVLATGGLAANIHFRHFLAASCPRMAIADGPAFTRARGLCLMARRGAASGRSLHFMPSRPKTLENEPDGARPLELKKSTFPDSEIIRLTDPFGNEMWHDLNQGERLGCSLGIDIGSTSTKAVLADDEGRIRLDIYTRTAGNPIEASRRIFKGIESAAGDMGCTIDVKCCGTTGSGRKLVGVVVGADLIVNEISAHAKGAKTLDDRVETIFEIGGQDSKFIRLKDGRIVDVNMNYVCAAGTGSFVEEQARTLGIGLNDIGPMVMGSVPLPNSDRCTVFMNQEITRQLAQGLPVERIMAGVLLAVFRNYLTKVVGNRPYSKERIVFQGATARNPGLVAALEQLTGAKVSVSPFCHVMGAYGAALLAREKLAGTTRFRGLAIPEISVRESTCRGCENSCRITHVEAGGEKTSWGHLCGREPGERRQIRRQNVCIGTRNKVVEGYASRYAKPGRQVVKMPALGLNDEFTPLFTEVMNACGYGLEILKPDRARILRELSTFGSGDFCWPVKVAMASAKAILEDDPGCRVMLPHLIQDRKNPSIHPRSLYCPFMSALPALIPVEGISRRLAAPTIDLSRPVREQARALSGAMRRSGLSPASPAVMRAAIERGLALTDQMRSEAAARARDVLDAMDSDERVIVLFGRPYNLYHSLLNLGIPELVESLGYRVVTLDAIQDSYTDKDVCSAFPDMYWAQGLKILRKALTVRERPGLFPLVISNFSCGPDSFILTYLEEIFRDKPYLILELDEHGSATGYQTRIEAFLDMIEQHGPREKSSNAGPSARRIRYSLGDIPEGTAVWIPQIHPYTPQLWAAVLCRHGIDARPLGEETASECACGRALCRGSECLPTAVTTGRFVSELSRSSGHGENFLFMPRAEGPCRFGQYATLQSMVMERVGMDNACIFSPTSEDGYAFLDRAAELAVWEALCLGDALYKLRCRIVPYHDHPDAAEALIEGALEEMCSAIRQGKDWRTIARDLPGSLDAGRCLARPRRPLVGIVGEIFVRLNLFSNQHLVEAVERHGGEAWLAPMSEWVHYVWRLLCLKSPFFRGLKARLKELYLHHAEQGVMNLFNPVLDDLHEPPLGKVLERGGRFLPIDFEGEAILTVGRARLFGEQGASIVVNCSPFGCMPGRITSYLFQAFPGYFRVPVVNLFFDGTGDISGQVGVYLRSITQAQGVPTGGLGAFRKAPGMPRAHVRGAFSRTEESRHADQ
jgi:predicted CoA-substrate-specific enzyme activase